MKKQFKLEEHFLTKLLTGSIVLSNTILFAIQGAFGGAEHFGGKIGAIIGASWGAVFGLGIGAAFVVIQSLMIKFIEDFMIALYDIKQRRFREKSHIKSITKSQLRYKLLKLSGFLFSPKTQTEVFLTEMADWDKEYSEALLKKEIWKARWINVRHTYAFLAAMWQKSPIGDLIEFIVKLAK